MQEGKRIFNGEFYGESMERQSREKAVSALFFHPMQTKNQQPHFCKLLIFRAENGTRTRDLNLSKVALSSPQNATRLGVTNWAISFYDDFLECVLPRFSHWLNGWLNICVCLLVCKWLLIRELFNGLNKFCNTFFLVIHWHSEFMVSK